MKTVLFGTNLAFDRCFFGLMPEPPTPPVRSFMDGYAVNPGLQTGLAMEVFHAAKNLQKYFLSGVGGIGGVGQDTIDNAVDRLMKFAHKPCVGFFRSRLQFLNNGGLLAADSEGAYEISQTGCSRHASHGDVLHYKSVDKTFLLIV